jgi:hypothetical protein
MRRLLAGVVLAASALVCVIAWELRGWEAAGPVRTMAPARMAVPTASDPEEAAPEWLAVVLARPLFSPTRRPDTVAEAVAAPDSEAPRLSGIVIDPSGKRAIFAAGPEGKSLVAREGSQVGGFVVRAIEPGRVVIEGEEGARSLKPSFSEAVASGAAPVPQARARGRPAS